MYAYAQHESLGVCTHDMHTTCPIPWTHYAVLIVSGNCVAPMALFTATLQKMPPPFPSLSWSTRHL